MSPLIIETREGITTIGSPGADRISSAIAQVLINFSKNNNWQESIDKPRFHVNGDGSVRDRTRVFDKSPRYYFN